MKKNYLIKFPFLVTCLLSSVNILLADVQKSELNIPAVIQIFDYNSKDLKFSISANHDLSERETQEILASVVPEDKFECANTQVKSLVDGFNTADISILKKVGARYGIQNITVKFDLYYGSDSGFVGSGISIIGNGERIDYMANTLIHCQSDASATKAIIEDFVMSFSNTRSLEVVFKYLPINQQIKLPFFSKSSPIREQKLHEEFCKIVNYENAGCSGIDVKKSSL